MAKNKIEIRVTKEVRKQLVKDFEACEKTVWNALKYETDSPAAKMIRKRALELGGEVWEGPDDSEALEAAPATEEDRDPYCNNGCTLKAYPPCDKGIPCCRCKDECNSRQQCPMRQLLNEEGDEEER